MFEALPQRSAYLFGPLGKQYRIETKLDDDLRPSLRAAQGKARGTGINGPRSPMKGCRSHIGRFSAHFTDLKGSDDQT